MTGKEYKFVWVVVILSPLFPHFSCAEPEQYTDQRHWEGNSGCLKRSENSFCVNLRELCVMQEWQTNNHNQVWNNHFLTFQFASSSFINYLCCCRSSLAFVYSIGYCVLYIIGYCVFVLKFVLAQAALRAPHEVAFGMRSWPLFLSLFSLSLFLSLSLSLFFSVFCFWPTSGNLPCAK